VLVAGKGFEPLKAEPGDLQSADTFFTHHEIPYFTRKKTCGMVNPKTYVCK